MAKIGRAKNHLVPVVHLLGSVVHTGSMAKMTAEQIYQVARGPGFPVDTATKMIAIAMKEPSGNPAAFNGRGPDESYGLWQINMKGALAAERLRQFGLTARTDLYDPNVNARVAYALWAGDDKNLDRHWAIERSKPDRERFQKYLPVAMAAARNAEGQIVASVQWPPVSGGESGGVDLGMLELALVVLFAVGAIVVFRG